MDEAGVGPRGEGVGAVGRDRRLGRHPRVGEGMGSGTGAEVVVDCNQIGIADRLEYLDLGPVAEHVEVGGIVDQPLAGPAAVARGLENGVIPDRPDRHLGIQDCLQPGAGPAPVGSLTFRQHGYAGGLGPTLVVDGETGAVGTAVTHLVQHAGSEFSQP